MSLLLDKAANKGFSLVELAVVLVVVGLLLVSLLGPLTAQQEQKSIMDSRRQLDEIREVLLGFLVANGRLPCPADPTLASANPNAGIERVGGCAANQIGVLPWRTLGLKEVDAWGHRFTYGVVADFADPATVAAAPISAATNGGIRILPLAGAVTPIVSQTEVVALVLSHGGHSDGAWGPSGGAPLPAGSDADELENSNMDLVFVDHPNTATTRDQPYDDLVVWVPRALILNKLLVAGRLP